MCDFQNNKIDVLEIKMALSGNENSVGRRINSRSETTAERIDELGNLKDVQKVMQKNNIRKG